MSASDLPSLSRPRASVVLPTLNGMPLVGECLEAIASQELEGGFEIIVVDSGSTDGTAELAEKYGKLIRIEPGSFNHGLTRNLAVSHARGEFVALIVQDATPVDSGWLRALVDCFEDEQIVGVYSRQVPRPDCPPLIRARLERWSATCTEREVKRLDSEDDLYGLPGLEQVRLLSFDNVSSCIRRSIWNEVPFEKRTFGEDINWAKAVMHKGYSVVFEPHSAVYHSHKNSLWYEFKRVYLDHQNWNRMIGLELFHALSEVIEASIRGLPVRWQEIREQDIRGISRVYWDLYSIPYSFSQNLAQYLGSRSNDLLERKRWYRRLDRLFRQGV